MPANATCELFGVTVIGNVVADHDSVLAMNGSSVSGSLTVQTPAVEIFDSTINGTGAFTAASGQIAQVQGEVCGSLFKGSVTISNEYGLSDGFVFGSIVIVETNLRIIGQTQQLSCGGNTVKGTLSVLNNDVLIFLGDNTISGGVTISGNDPGVQIFGNAVGGGLSCLKNTALDGQGTNNAHGHETGQCAGF